MSKRRKTWKKGQKSKTNKERTQQKHKESKNEYTNSIGTAEKVEEDMNTVSTKNIITNIDTNKESRN